MLNNEIRNNDLFAELENQADALDVVLVDVRRIVKGPAEILISITIMCRDKEAGIDECARFHRAVQPRLELIVGRDVLSMEVSTPGLQRIFRDVYEFSVFTGKRCRVYSSAMNNWISGVIVTSGDSSVVLHDYRIEDTPDSGESIEISFNDIQKARLDYRWEDVKNVRVK